MTTTSEHAQRELRLAGHAAEDPGYAVSVVASIAALMSYGHSGGSLSAAIDHLNILLRRGTFTPLTNHPDEWSDESERSGTPFWQNVRCPAAFSEDGGQTFWLLDDLDAGRPPLPVELHDGVRGGKAMYRTVDPPEGYEL